MQLTDKQIEQFRLLWKNRFGEEISRKDAFEKGIELVCLMERIYKPMKITDFKKLEERRKTHSGKPY